MPLLEIQLQYSGTYGEWVKPFNKGVNDLQRIVYRAAKGEDVSIKGSEQITGWKKYKGDVWKVTLNNEMFGDFNPYKEIMFGDWLLKTYGRDHHLGEVYLNGEALYENDSLEKVWLLNPWKE